MAKRRRGGRQRGNGAGEGSSAERSGGFIGQVGLFESANGMPHGPVSIALAIVAAVLILPVTRFVRYLTRR
jgi:hypothetical protein